MVTTGPSTPPLPDKDCQAVAGKLAPQAIEDPPRSSSALQTGQGMVRGLAAAASWLLARALAASSASRWALSQPRRKGNEGPVSD